ncbi:MAG: hypothetical protein ACT6R2_18655, partial [Blastomonas fulva]|uniref:hypothetical protein n=1 Tax=Blastomonas fulva TaxID=1550728 RepID=UPI0040338B2A
RSQSLNNTTLRHPKRLSREAGSCHGDIAPETLQACRANVLDRFDPGPLGRRSLFAQFPVCVILKDLGKGIAHVIRDKQGNAAYAVFVDDFGRLPRAFPLPFKDGGAGTPIEFNLNENAASRLKVHWLFGQATLSGLSFRKGIANFRDKAETVIRTNSV